MQEETIFSKYFTDEPLIDRKAQNNEMGVDVIIPLINTNELFERNLKNIYKEVPIENLFIGDGGCTDNSIKIAKKFPRVQIIDQTKYKSLGICITELISKVKTKWFIYFHADVFLPEGWYECMKNHQSEYDFFECNRKITVMVEYFMENLKEIERGLSGSQMGRTQAFKNIWPKIEDGYLQRNEDIILKEMILQEGYKYGRVFDTFHYHQVMNRRGELEPKFKKVSIEKETDELWEIRVYKIQVQGIVKYCTPKPYIIKNVNDSIQILLKYNAIPPDLKNWIKETNPIWLKHLKFKKNLRNKLYPLFKRFLKK